MDYISLAQIWTKFYCLEGGYTEQQIINVDEAGLFWKMAPTKNWRQQIQLLGM